jgi:tetratricopeptide (TPR) repeat protein
MSTKTSCILPIVVSFIACGVYLATLCPTIGWVDSGELTIVAHTLGIAHPSGYPLYTLLGRLFTLLPWGSLAWRLNLLSAVCAAVAAGVVSLLCLRVVEYGVNGGQGRERSEEGLIGWVAGMVGGLLMAFSLTLWSVAVVSEVYSLTLLLAAIILLLAVRAGEGSSPRVLGMGAFLLGLAFGNHMIVFVVAIGVFAYLMLSPGRPSVRQIGPLVLLFLLGFSIQLYLPVRSATHPLMDWGAPRTWPRYFYHATGGQYQVWMFSEGGATFVARAKGFGRLVSQQMTPFLLWLPILGLYHMVRRSWRLGVLLASVAVVDVAYSLNYAIPDIEPYYLPAFMVICIWSGLGAASLFSMARRHHRLASVVVGIVMTLLPLVPLLGHYPRMDMSRNRIAYEYGLNVLASMEQDPICLTNNWDIYSPFLYLRYGEGRRQDVCMIDKELLRRSWYFAYLEREYPWLIEASRDELDAYLELLYRFEDGTLEGSQTIQERFIALINSFIHPYLDERPVYITFADGIDVDGPFIAPDLYRIPRGLVYQLQRDTAIAPFDPGCFVTQSSRDPRVYKDERTNVNLSRYARVPFHRSLVFVEMGLYGEAESELRRALDWEPENPASLRNLAICLIHQERYQEALEQIEVLLKLQPADEDAHRMKVWVLRKLAADDQAD